jgi:hypothetical protein
MSHIPFFHMRFKMAKKPVSKAFTADEFETVQQLYQQSGDLESVRKHIKKSGDKKGLLAALSELEKTTKLTPGSKQSAKRKSPGSRG